jgi:hypothetical protein
MHWIYPEDLAQLTTEDVQWIKDNMDEYFDERNIASEEFEKTILDRFAIASKKFSVLKKINSALEQELKSNPPSDVVMLLMFEDNVKYCAIEYSEIITKVLGFLDMTLSKHLHLFKKNSIEKMVSRLSVNNPEHASEYQKRLLEFHRLWAEFFPKGSKPSGNPSGHNIDILKKKLELTHMKLKTYRDKVAAHFDDKDARDGKIPPFLWSELKEIVEKISSFLESFYFLLSHANYDLSGNLDGLGFTTEENTVRSYMTGFFQNYECAETNQDLKG